MMEMYDRGVAAFSQEARFPFLDRRLVEFCLAIPAEQKLHQGRMRMIVRRALAGVLPEAVRWRDDKASIAINFRRALLGFEGPRLQRVLHEDAEILAPYVNLEALRETHRRFARGSAGTEASVVLVAVLLALWLRRTGLGSGADRG